MGREVTGIQVVHNSSPVKVKPNAASNVAHDAAEKHEEKSTSVGDQKSSSPPASGPITVGNVQIKHPAPKPCDVESDKRACVSPIAAETLFLAKVLQSMRESFSLTLLLFQGSFWMMMIIGQWLLQSLHL